MVEKDGVVDGAEVKQEEDGKGARPGGEGEVISDFWWGRFSLVVGTEAGLECIKELAGIEIWLKLHDHRVF